MSPDVCYPKNNNVGIHWDHPEHWIVTELGQYLPCHHGAWHRLVEVK